MLLGPRGWQHYQHEHFTSWQHFRWVVGKEFGLSSSQLSARFFGLHPQGGESSPSFVLRVEQERRSIAANEEATLHCFKGRLDVAMQREMESVRRTKVTLQGQNLLWVDVVAIARDMLTQPPLEPALTTTSVPLPT